MTQVNRHLNPESEIDLENAADNIAGEAAEDDLAELDADESDGSGPKYVLLPRSMCITMQHMFATQADQHPKGCVTEREGVMQACEEAKRTRLWLKHSFTAPCCLHGR